jgi:hypothetical protein
MSVRRLPILVLAPLLWLTGCRESKVTAYRIPKEKEAAALPPGHPPAGTTMPGMEAAAGGGTGVSGSSMADTAVPTVTGNALAWTAPGEWQPQPAGAMRKASYTLSGPEGTADLSVTAFPGDVGGELANINRWRGQVGYTPLAPANLDQNVDRTESNGLHLTIVDLTDAQKPKGTLGALVPYGGGVWFFKLTGPTALVARQKARFLAFLKTIKASAP